MAPLSEHFRRGTTLVATVTLLFAGLGITCAAEPESAGNIVVQNAYIRFRDRVTLAFERQGILAKLPFREGDAVEEQAVVAQLNDTVARRALAVAAAEAASDAEVRVARKNHESAELEYRAVQEANARKANTYVDTEVQRLKLAAEAAVLQTEVKTQALELARLRLEQAAAEVETFTLRAPFSGIVTSVQRQVGEAVQQRDPVLELVNTRHARVDGYVDLASAWRLRPGDTVEVRFQSPDAAPQLKDRVYRGTLRFIDVSTQPVRRVVRVLADFENPDMQLRDGLAAEMTIVPSVPPESPPRATVPSVAK
jgi:RND family efflux transporter MFP subunit